MKSRDVKTALYKEAASVTKALANPHRLEILDLLAQGAVSVEYIAEQNADARCQCFTAFAGAAQGRNSRC